MNAQETALATPLVFCGRCRGQVAKKASVVPGGGRSYLRCQCLRPDIQSSALRTPVAAVEWVCHAATTIKDADGMVLAECGGHGRHTDEDVVIAAEIVRRVNAHDELLAALERCRSLLATCEVRFSGDFQQRMRSATSQASAAIAKATGSTS